MKNKKIGIVTFHRAENYGAILQAYSLYSTLKTMGNNEVKIIDYRSKEIEKPYKLIYFGNDNRIIYNLLKSIALFKKNYIKKQNFKLFRESNISMTKSIYDRENFFNILNNYDYIITGSDQVWNLDITLTDKDIYLLNNSANNKKYEKISYAASIGSDFKNNYFYDIISKSIKDYKSISVREEIAKNNLSEYTTQKISVCLDPVLLQKSSFWNKVSCKSNIKEDYLFVYTIDLDKKMIDFVDKLASEKKLLIVHVDKKGRYKEKSKSMYHCGPDIFLDLICNSKYIITNSFHGLAFSIIYKKQFVVFPKKGRNSRIENLLKICGLENRSFSENLDIDNKINYESTEKKLDEHIKKSYNFIEKAIYRENINERK